MTDFLSAFVGSASRAKMLRLFLFNGEAAFTATEAAKRAQVTKAAARKEISFLKRLGVVKTMPVSRAGKKEVGYGLNAESSHARILQIFVRDTSAVDHQEIVTRLRPAGRLKLVVASGSFVDDASSRVDLLIVGDALDERKLQTALRSVEADLGRDLRYAAFLTDEFQYRMTIYDKLIRDVLDYPHRIFLDKLGVGQE
ncbi:MAG TPA: hypothetical protein VFL98_04035 [Candidatus Paceibacterota bacterium]|nr:hypothetical protein [Candidatus Paceibacterota bacterium]